MRGCGGGSAAAAGLPVGGVGGAGDNHLVLQWVWSGGGGQKPRVGEFGAEGEEAERRRPGGVEGIAAAEVVEEI